MTTSPAVEQFWSDYQKQSHNQDDASKCFIHPDLRLQQTANAGLGLFINTALPTSHRCLITQPSHTHIRPAQCDIAELPKDGNHIE